MTLYRFGCYGLIGLGLLHLVVLGMDAANYASALAAGELWTWEHWGPLSNQSADLVSGGFAFWSTVGSFAVPFIGLGALLVSLDRRGVHVPRILFVGLLAWLLVCSALMPPSGFPAAFAIAVCLLVGRQGAAPRRVTAEASRV